MDIASLSKKYYAPGKVSWIGIRPERRANVVPVKKIKAISNKGLEGDHYANPGGSRQITLIQAEHLTAVSSFLNQKVDPKLVRRNIVVKGINLLGLKGRRFKIGEVILEYTGECHPVLVWKRIWERVDTMLCAVMVE